MRPYRMFAPVRAVISRMVRKASYTRVTEQVGPGGGGGAGLCGSLHLLGSRIFKMLT